MVRLASKHISRCIACLGCFKDSGCKVDDDLKPLRGDHDRRRVTEPMQKKGWR